MIINNIQKYSVDLYAEMTRVNKERVKSMRSQWRAFICLKYYKLTDSSENMVMILEATSSYDNLESELI